VWREGVQVQRVSIVGEEEKDSICSEAAKGTPTEGAGTPCKEKSAGRRKKLEEDGERRGSMCGQATRSTARVEKEFGGKVEKKSKETLWQRSAGGSISTRVRIVHRESNSDICVV